MISSHIENDPSAFYDYEAYKTAVAEVKKIGLLRAESIEGQLNDTIPSTTAGQTADSKNLIDASSINLSALGGMGIGGQGGFGGFGGFGGNMERPQGGFGGNMERPQGGFGGNMERPQGGFGGMGNPWENANNFMGQNPGFGNQQPATDSSFQVGNWLIIAFCAIILSTGLLFVVKFKRRIE